MHTAVPAACASRPPRTRTALSSHLRNITTYLQVTIEPSSGGRESRKRKAPTPGPEDRQIALTVLNASRTRWRVIFSWQPEAGVVLARCAGSDEKHTPPFILEALASEDPGCAWPEGQGDPLAVLPRASRPYRCAPCFTLVTVAMQLAVLSCALLHCAPRNLFRAVRKSGVHELLAVLPRVSLPYRCVWSSVMAACHCWS